MSYSLSIQFDLSSAIERAFQTHRSASKQASRKVRQVSKGETIYAFGDATTAVYHLELGRVRMTRYTPDGKQLTLRTVLPGEMFGETDLYLDTHECEASAEEDSRIVVYPSSQIISWVSEDSHLANALLHQAHLLLLLLKKRLALLTIQSAKERTLEYLRERAHESSGEVRQPINLNKPLKAVAEELDISPETFYRLLARLESDGFIRRNRRQITLLK